MKKILVFLLAICFVFTLAGCGDEEVSSVTSTGSVESKVESAVESVDAGVSSEAVSSESEPEPEPEPNILENIKSGGGPLTEEMVVSAFDSATFTALDGTLIPYRIYLPSNYDKNKNYPLVTFLHGAGERGTDNIAQLNNMMWELFDYNIEQMSNAIVIAPQCPTGNQWVDTPWANGNYSTTAVSESNELKAVTELINHINSEYSTDIKRQYVIGLSMGGFGTWDLIMRHSDMFTAAVPVCGGADPSVAQNLKDFPVYTVHGDSDPTVPVTGTREMAEALKNAGNTVYKYEEVAGGAHNVWVHTATKTDAVKWLFNQTK